MTSSAGWNLQVFRGRIRISEHGEHLEPVFGGKRANLEAGQHKRRRTRKTHSEFAVFSAFCTKNGVVTKTGDIGKTFSGLKNLAVLQGFETKNPNELGGYRPSFLTTDPFFWDPLFSLFCFLFFLSPAKVGSLEMQPEAKLILQPHACTQRFRLRILRRTRSNAGRTSAGSF